MVLTRVTGILEEFALKGHLQRRDEPQSIGYGNESGFDYVSPQAERYECNRLGFASYETLR